MTASTRKFLAPLFLFLISLFLVQPVYAQDALNSKNFNYFINGQTTIEGSMGHELFCGLMGSSPLNQCAGYKITDGSHAELLLYDHLPNGGALGMMSSTMLAMYTTPPTSASMYLADLGQSIGIIPQDAYAQTIGGSGEQIIRPVLTLWQTIRNIVYLFFVVIFIVVGLMIMFRQNIGGHGAHLEVTAQQALPGLVIGLILVTFSYFISALLVDMTFVGTDLVVEIFAQTGQPNTFGPNINSNDTLENRQNALRGSFRGVSQNAGIAEMVRATGLNFDSIRKVASGVVGQSVNFAPQLNASNIGSSKPRPAWVDWVTNVVNAPFNIISTLIAGAVGSVLSVLVIIILLLALVFQMFRLTISLLIAYIEILVLTVLSPIFILIGSIPGRGATTTQWWKGILANALIFPAVFAVFLFAGLILGSTTSFDTTFPMFGNLNGDLLKVVLAYALILGSPSVPGMVRQLLGVQGMGNIGQIGIGGFMLAANVVRTPAHNMGHDYYMRNLHDANANTTGARRVMRTVGGSILGWNRPAGTAAGGHGQAH